jgi:hypothetical protein
MVHTALVAAHAAETPRLVTRQDQPREQDALLGAMDVVAVAQGAEIPVLAQEVEVVLAVVVTKDPILILKCN